MNQHSLLTTLSATLILLLLLLGLWWFGVNLAHIPSYFLPSIYSVIASLHDNFVLIFSAAGYTLAEALLGLIIAFITALMLASLAYFIRPLALILKPLALLSQALPFMVLSPLIVLWLGFGWSAKLTIVVLSLFFPMFIANLNGFESIPRLWLELSFTLEGGSAKPMRRFYYLILPGAYKHMSAGIKIAVAWAMLAAIIAEWVGGNNGLGFLMQNALSRLDSALLFASLMVLIILSLGLYGLSSAVLRLTHSD